MGAVHVQNVFLLLYRARGKTHGKHGKVLEYGSRFLTLFQHYMNNLVVHHFSLFNRQLLTSKFPQICLQNCALNFSDVPKNPKCFMDKSICIDVCMLEATTHDISQNPQNPKIAIAIQNNKQYK